MILSFIRRLCEYFSFSFPLCSGCVCYLEFVWRIRSKHDENSGQELSRLYVFG